MIFGLIGLVGRTDTNRLIVIIAQLYIYIAIEWIQSQRRIYASAVVAVDLLRRSKIMRR